MRAAIIILALLAVQVPAHAQCGSRGGPGYRDLASRQLRGLGEHRPGVRLPANNQMRAGAG
jgi:hypothetical protein